MSLRTKSHHQSCDQKRYDKRDHQMKKSSCDLKCLTQFDLWLFYALQYRVYCHSNSDHPSYPYKGREYMQEDNRMVIHLSCCPQALLQDRFLPLPMQFGSYSGLSLRLGQSQDDHRHRHRRLVR